MEHVQLNWHLTVDVITFNIPMILCDRSKVRAYFVVVVVNLPIEFQRKREPQLKQFTVQWERFFSINKIELQLKWNEFIFIQTHHKQPVNDECMTFNIKISWLLVDTDWSVVFISNSLKCGE